MANVLFNATIKVAEDAPIPQICDEVWKHLQNYEYIYSYVVYCRKEIGIYQVNYMVSQNKEYNTINTLDAMLNIIEIIVNDSVHDRVIGYNQPSIDVLIETLQPLVHTLAKEQYDHWKCFEYDDLVQMCNLVICELYNKGYYIHKSIVRKSFMNYVLMQLRPKRDEPQIISIHQRFHGTDDMEKLTIGDTIVDESYQIEDEESYDREVIAMIFAEVKDIIIDLIGPRQFDQLFRDYGMKHTTSQTRRMMQKIKTHFANMGITMKEFKNKYYG